MDLTVLHLMAGGLAFATFGFAIFTTVDADTRFLTFALGSFIFSIGMAPAHAPAAIETPAPDAVS